MGLESASKHSRQDRMKPENVSARPWAPRSFGCKMCTKLPPWTFRRDASQDAMSLRLIEWPGDRYQWSVRDSAQTAQRILHKQRVCNIAIICNTPPASRLD
eukprot:6641617-Prymnesium_polylepis.2